MFIMQINGTREGLWRLYYCLILFATACIQIRTLCKKESAAALQCARQSKLLILKTLFPKIEEYTKILDPTVNRYKPRDSESWDWVRWCKITKPEHTKLNAYLPFVGKTVNLELPFYWSKWKMLTWWHPRAFKRASSWNNESRIYCFLTLNTFQSYFFDNM